jgi:hypothetical protein
VKYKPKQGSKVPFLKPSFGDFMGQLFEGNRNGLNKRQSESSQKLVCSDNFVFFDKSEHKLKLHFSFSLFRIFGFDSLQLRQALVSEIEQWSVEIETTNKIFVTICTMTEEKLGN